MNQTSKKWIWNRKTLQGLYCAVFGQYCIYFVLLRFCCVSLHSITSQFLSNLSENDRRIARFIRNLYIHIVQSLLLKFVTYTRNIYMKSLDSG